MATPRIDIAGQVFGRLTALEYAGGRKCEWRCKCECGTKCEVAGSKLRKGHTQSCGCLNREQIDIAGQVFGRLTAIEYVGGNQYKWLCRCECGTKHEVDGSSLRRGHTQSCGCLQKEVVSELKTTHGLSKHPIYQTWQQMKDRCYNPTNPSFAHYGGKGVTVSPRWRDDFPTFLADMGARPDGLTLDRIDNGGDYNPVNCRWATQLIQNGNTSRSSQVPGVRFVARYNKYRATITVDGRQTTLGSYKQHSDAAYQRLSYEALVDQGADASHLKLLRKFIKAVTGNKPVREPLYV